MHHPALTIAVLLLLFLVVAVPLERRRNRRLHDGGPGPDKASSPVPSDGPLPALPGSAWAEAERAYAEGVLAHAKTPGAAEITRPPDS